MPNTKTKFHEGEKVLCFHGPLLYEAKVLKTQVKDKAPRYMIHYSGWKTSWDEWVPESRVLKHTPESLAKQKEIEKQCNKKSTRRGTRGGLIEESSSRSSSPGLAVLDVATKSKAKDDASSTGGESGIRKKRSRVDPCVETEPQFTTRIEVRVRVPDELKPWLVDDWDLVTRQSKLVNLPARQSVSEILQGYLSSKQSKLSQIQWEALSEVIKGLKEYFNVMLGSQLLYKFERGQYQEILQSGNGKQMVDIYGSIHLLRLFVRLGSMLAYTSLDEKAMQELIVHAHDLLRYIAKHSATLFSHADYIVPPPEYHRKIYAPA